MRMGAWKSRCVAVGFRKRLNLSGLSGGVINSWISLSFLIPLFSEACVQMKQYLIFPHCSPQSMILVRVQVVRCGMGGKYAPGAPCESIQSSFICWRVSRGNETKETRGNSSFVYEIMAASLYHLESGWTDIGHTNFQSPADTDTTSRYVQSHSKDQINNLNMASSQSGGSKDSKPQEWTEADDRTAQSQETTRREFLLRFSIVRVSRLEEQMSRTRTLPETSRMLAETRMTPPEAMIARKLMI